ncbi:TPA: tyrosine-type recombinase/integrase [Pseudomonas aeruginosa]
MTDFLVLKGGTYHARLDVPSDVREAFGGRKVLSKSLKTGERSKAHVLKLKWLETWKAQIDDARKRPGENFRDEIVYITEKFQDKIKAELKQPFNYFNPDPTPTASMQMQLETLQVIKKHNLKDELKNEAISIMAGQSEYSPKTPFFKKRLEEFDDYERNIRKVIPRTVDSHIARLKILRDYMTKNEAELSHETIAEFLNSLDLSAKTKKQYIFSYNSFWNWAFKKDKVFRERYAKIVHPFKNHEFQEIRRGMTKETGRRAFKQEEIQKLYNSALEQENQKLADLIKLGAYTGARIEELCQLKLEDIFVEEGVECFHIREGKTDAAVRLVPVHSALKEDLERLKKESTDGFLLKNSRGGKYEKRSKDIGNTFSLFKTALGFDKKCVFHSFRKSVITSLERADVRNLVIMAIVGHEPGGALNLTFDVYSEGPTPTAKKAAIETIAWGI